MLKQLQRVLVPRMVQTAATVLAAETATASADSSGLTRTQLRKQHRKHTATCIKALQLTAIARNAEFLRQFDIINGKLDMLIMAQHGILGYLQELQQQQQQLQQQQAMNQIMTQILSQRMMWFHHRSWGLYLTVNGLWICIALFQGLRNCPTALYSCESSS